MAKKIANEEEFKESLNKLGQLYEDAKDLTTKILPINPDKEQWEAYHTLRGILQEMANLAAVQMQHKHWIGEN